MPLLDGGIHDTARSDRDTQLHRALACLGCAPLASHLVHEDVGNLVL
jgi:hypothetical protein